MSGRERREGRSHLPERARAEKVDTGRPQKVAARVREELSSMILRGELREPAAGRAMVSSVEATRDLSLVKVGLRTFDPRAGAAEQAAIVAAFQRAAGFLRSRIGKELGLRTAPELRFFHDRGADHAARIEELLAGDAEDDA
jgi:ribosome-binding factor A